MSRVFITKFINLNSAVLGFSLHLELINLSQLLKDIHLNLFINYTMLYSMLIIQKKINFFNDLKGIIN